MTGGEAKRLFWVTGLPEAYVLSKRNGTKGAEPGKHRERNEQKER